MLDYKMDFKLKTEDCVFWISFVKKVSSNVR